MLTALASPQPPLRSMARCVWATAVPALSLQPVVEPVVVSGAQTSVAFVTLHAVSLLCRSS
jgi:hypothetical protein